MCRETRSVRFQNSTHYPADNNLSHCPWVYNCIGVNNHRHFFLYLVFLELGVALLVRLTFACKYLDLRNRA